MIVQPLLIVYCALIVVASVSGGHLTSLMRMTHLRTQLLMSFVGGLMLGIALLHLLPHADRILRSSSTTGIAALIGIVGMFLLLRAFHQHHHHGPPGVAEHDECKHEHHIHHHHHDEQPESEPTSSDDSHDHDGYDHDGHDHSGHAHDHATHEKGLGWIGMLLGLGLHTMIDGVALAASVIAESHHDPWLGLAGFGTFLAVALHKPLDAFAITSTMKASGWTTRQQDFVNLAFSLACPVGALLFCFGVSQAAGDSMLLGWGLAISAGFFICIALSDLLPEVAFHDHDRGKLTVALFIGIGLAVLVENLPGHSHQGHQHQHEHERSVETPAQPER